MGRKNDRVRQARVKRDRQRGEKAIKIRKPDYSYKRPDVEDMIMPDGQCYFQSRKPKARFGTEEKAQAALKQAQYMRARQGSTRVEKRYYACPEGGCGGYHLTSREEFDDSVRRFRQEQYEQRSKNTARTASEEQK